MPDDIDTVPVRGGILLPGRFYRRPGLSGRELLPIGGYLPHHVPAHDVLRVGIVCCGAVPSGILLPGPVHENTLQGGLLLSRGIHHAHAVLDWQLLSAGI